MIPRVVVADATAFVRMAARVSLMNEGIAVAAEVALAEQALEVVSAEHVDAVLLDGALDPDMATVARILDVDPCVAVIVFAPDESDALALAAVRAGACGIIPKDTPPGRLPAIVRGAVAGEAAIPRRVVRRLLDDLCEDRRRKSRGATEGLTARERDILSLLCDGLGDGQIAHSLGISATTVRRHVGTAMHKYGVASRAAAVDRFRHGDRRAVQVA